MVYLTDLERAMLARALREWHETDTKTKELIADDDEQHYFIEDLSRQLEWTDPDYGILYHREPRDPTSTPEKYHRIVDETDEKFYVDIRAIIYKKELENYASLDYCIGVLHDLIAEELESK